MKRLAQCLITVSILIGLWLIGWPSQEVQAADGGGGYRVYLPAILTGGSSIPATGGQAEAVLTLETFAAQVADGQAGVVRGIYVEGVLAYRVDQQPAGNYLYITSQPDTVTQFGLVKPPVIGLLAHNTLAGAKFFDLREGMRLWVIEGDGRTQAYRIGQRFEYQALEPNSPTSSFKDLTSGEVLTAAQVFERHYQGAAHVTLQTCIAREGVSTWGRLFVIAEPEP